MARPSLPWEEKIKPAYEAGKDVDEIVKEFEHIGLKKKTLQNRISLEKWERSGKAIEAISQAVEVSGKLRELREEFPEIAKHAFDKVEKLTEFNILMEDTVLAGIKLQKELFKDKKVQKTTINYKDGEAIPVYYDEKMKPRDIKEGMEAIQKAKEIVFGKEATTQINNTNAQQNNIPIEVQVTIDD